MNPPDEKARWEAVHERERNVLIDAGAGSGKTTILVRRVIQLVAPDDDGPAFALDRIVAITFTRRAAGELRFRLRECLLRELGTGVAGDLRQKRLRTALGMLDRALVGTIHSFCDRLLRRYPMQARLSPAYKIAEDDSAVVEEAAQRLLALVEDARLTAECQGPLPAEAVADAEAALRAAMEPDCVLARSRDRPFGRELGLDAFIGSLIRNRDSLPNVPRAVFEVDKYRTAAREFLLLSAGLDGDKRGTKWLKRVRRFVQETQDVADPATLYPLVQLLDVDFKGADFDVCAAQETDNALRAIRTHKGRTPLADELKAPLQAWLACALMRVAPAAITIYDDLKARYQVVDNIDLLLKLRDLLREHPDVRCALQDDFDHILVDEFQDTDPLQAEIVLYLSERGASAKRWQDVSLASGRLTVVGDPKQSIYGFRRADVAIYDEVRHRIQQSPHIAVKLETSFRSLPRMVEWQNLAFAGFLGVSPSGKIFDSASGQVYHAPLKPIRDDSADAAPVLELRYEPEEPESDVDTLRRAEARTFAVFLRWLIEKSGRRVNDAVTGELRNVRYEDVAVLTAVTTNLHLLFGELDTYAVPYAAAGGRLFLTDPVHQSFVLGLRALADPDDGVAQAALLRPPFFAIDLADLSVHRATNGEDPGGGCLRVREAMTCVARLRGGRRRRSPGATALALLEETGFGRAIALGSNGEQRLARVRHLCFELERRAVELSLDFDGITAHAREWIDFPVEMDAPPPVGGDAIRVMTVHQAKGLEFPVVMIWDACAQLKARDFSAALSVARSKENSWSIDIQGLEWNAGGDASARRATFDDHERRRLFYVAATRARDLLVLPSSRASEPEKHVSAKLLEESKRVGVEVFDVFSTRNPPTWATGIDPIAAQDVKTTSDVTPAGCIRLETDVLRDWMAKAKDAARARLRPVAVSVDTLERSQISSALDDVEGSALKVRIGRFGPIFGETVHRAICLVLLHSLSPGEAVARASKASGLAENLDVAGADVERAIEALRRENVFAASGFIGSGACEIDLEVPIAGEGSEGTMLVGSIDLLVADGTSSYTIIDFKTDRAPTGTVVSTHPQYVEQVRTYAALVGRATGVTKLQCGLLFTDDGTVHWV
jgi:ATP-dependent exoDNAse (exonuclease V) beta subunit